MRGAEQGFLLLTSHLGNPDRRPLTTAQFRTLALRLSQTGRKPEQRDLCPEDLIALGYDRAGAKRIADLLAEEELLGRYLFRGQRRDCYPITRVSEGYPAIVRQRLGLDAPGCLWVKGDPAILNTPAVALVGSRDLREPNRKFAETVGREAARQGITLVSGNARGADRTAQQACLDAGGKVISIVADELQKQPLCKNVLYMAEEGYDLTFSAIRALSRNHVIHALGHLTCIAQCTMGTGGTWDGSLKNLRNGWSPLFCFDDGSPAATELEQMGATLISYEDLSDFSALQSNTISLL